jgi:uncharacterized protein with ParB-like and HNH nuclease domain
LGNVIDSDKAAVNRLFSDFWFRIPYYQRPYLWQEDNVSELLDDVWFAFEDNPAGEYFIGALVLDREEERLDNGTPYTVYDVIDGQQRLTTLLLILAALRDICHKNAYDEGAKVMQDLIFQKGVSLLHIPERMRITYKLRDNVEEFIKGHILPLGATTRHEELSEIHNKNNISVSNMVANLLTIHEFFQDHSPTTDFLDFLINHVVCIYVATDDRNDAFRLFSIVNNRGIPLSNADLIKANNIGAIAGEKLQYKYSHDWEEIENSLGSDGFERFLSFLRTILVKDKARFNLVEEFERNVYGKGILQRGETTIKFIMEYSEVYARVIEFDGFDAGNDYKNLLTIMKIGLPSEDWIPPLLAFYQKFKGKASLTSLLTAFARHLEAKCER